MTLPDGFVLEDELAFSFDPSSAREVLNAIWPEKEYVNVDGVTFWRRSVTISRTVHLYTQPLDAGDKCRIKVERVGGKMHFTCDAKTYVDGQKFERTAWKAIDKRARKPLRQAAPMISALAKERVSLHYRAATRFGDCVLERRMKASIDRIKLLNGAGDAATSASIYHLDLEGDGKGLQQIFVQSNYFEQTLKHVLKPLTYAESKWLLAARHISQPVDLAGMAFADLAALVRRGLSSLDS